MTKTIVKTTLAMALLAGCGGSGFRDVSTPEEVDDPTPIGTSTEALSVDLRVKGANTAGFSNLFLSPSHVRVWADGQLVQVQPASELVDLANTGHSEKIATVMVPTSAKSVEFEVSLGAAGGFEGTNASGWINTRSKVIRFKSSFENLAEKNKAVIAFDTQRSFLEYDETMLSFVPKFEVMY